MDIKKPLRALKDLLDPPLGADAQPLEIRAAVIDAIERKITILGIGRTTFPYERVGVRLVAPDRDRRATLQQVFGDLGARIRERLRERRCEVPGALEVRVSFVRKRPPEWGAGQLFAIDCENGSEAEQEKTTGPSWPLLTVTVVKGTATKKAYSFRAANVLIGRTQEAADTRGRVRRNHVAFEDANATVSRAHARLKYDSGRPGYRVLDEGSARGTRVVRGGISIAVPHDPRGLRLESGDEIHLGDAVVRVTIG